MNQQFFIAPAFNQTERHNKNHNKFNEKTSNNVKYMYLFLYVWLTAQKEWRSFLVSLGWSLSEVVVISLKLEGTFVLQYFSPYYCYYVSPPKPNLIVLMGSGKLLGWILTWALIIIFFSFFFFEQDHFLSSIEEGIYWICIWIISLIYNPSQGSTCKERACHGNRVVINVNFRFYLYHKIQI